MDIVSELVELLRIEGTFEADDDSTQYRVDQLRSTLDEFGAELTHFGELRWRRPNSADPLDSNKRQASRTKLTNSSRTTINGVMTINPKVFIVYGHDKSLRNEVELSLRNWGLHGEQIIILDNLPSGGLTLIEKFEQHSQDAAFAIVLGTPDDLGHRKGHPEESGHRARQNVILEFGYFLAKLGRDRVAFIDGGIERPSDINGLLAINTKDHDWTTRLAREMKEVGIPVDFL